MKTISDITKELGHSKIDILKMDIEGYEYDVIEDILKSNLEICQILIELHDRFFENGYKKSQKLVKIMLEYGYEIFATSDSFEEVSFIKI